MKTLIVPVSGGKDSQVVLALALLTGRPIVCVHQNTGWDHPLTYKHIQAMECYYKVPIEHTVNKWGGMLPWLKTSAYFPNSAARGCTQRLKQEPFAKWLMEKGYNAENCEIWFGMRSDESAARNDKYGGITMDDDFTLGDIARFYNEGKRKHLGLISVKLPIVEWTTEDVFNFLRISGAPVNELYGKGHTRVGCYPCFLARKAEWVACGKDPVGVKHLTDLISLEDEWNQRPHKLKFIKVHRTWDVRNFIDPNVNPDDMPEDEQGCGWCSI